MKLGAICGKCLKRTMVPFDPPPAEVTCVCGERRVVNASASIRDLKIVDLCALCGSGYFYVEKSFNRWVGLSVITIAIVAFLWTITINWFVAMGILVGAALLDAVAYAFAGDRTICYQCLAEYTGGVRNPGHKAYDLGVAGRFTDDYEQKRDAEERRRDADEKRAR